MKRFLILAAVSALIMARPETYKEQEDFQYSRSSSDDGTKSGYYGAQRGNMGGNYERAHNMDALAQHQMSGLVRQVNGDLGDGVKTRSGSVYSAANSRGTYGSGSFDLSNLAGRNFQEGTFSENSQLRSAQHSSSAHNNAGYASSSSQNYGSNRKIASDMQIQTDNLQSLDNMQANNQHNYGSSRRSSGYQSQAGFQEHGQYNSDSTNSNSGYGSTQYTRLTPVRIIVRPGGRVAIPVGTQVYDATQGSAVINHNGLSSGDELAGEINQGSVNRHSNTQRQESYYIYEKHATIPPPIVVYPTESPIPKNSELHEDLDVHRSNYQKNADFQNTHLSSTSRRYNAAQASSQSRYQTNLNSQQSSADSNLNAFTHSGYNSQLNRGVASDSSNAYTHAQRNSGSRYYGVSADSNLNTQTRHSADSQLDLNDQVEGLNTRPKSYQSSYSYHKSWERQGDPYVIKPASSGYYDSQTSQRLTSSTKNLGYTTFQPSSNYGNCDEKCHIRVSRSHGTDNQDSEQQQSQSFSNDQHVQGTWTNLEDLSQQSQKNWAQPNEQQAQYQWDNLRDLSQQSQNTWDQQNVGQQSQTNWDNLKDLTQQSQNTWDQQNVGQQSQTNWDNLKDLTQQSQTNWDHESVGQQSQTNWDQQSVGQQSQTNWDQQSVGQQSQNHWDNLEDLGQQSQTNWDQQNVGQQTQNQWDRLEDLGQKNKQDVPQQTEHQGSNSQDMSQQSQTNWDQQNQGQQSQDHWDNLEDLGQQSQHRWDKINVGQQTPNKENNLDQQSQSNWGTLDVGQHSLGNKWDKLEDITQSGNKQDDSKILEQQAQNNQDDKSQEDLYALYEHKLEVNQPNIQLKHPQPSNEKENNMKVEIPSDKFVNHDSDKSKIAFNQKITTSYTDDVVTRQVLQSHKVNFNNHDDVLPHQKDSNDNTDYSYSNGFVNPFFNQNYKNQLSSNENTYAPNSPDFQNIWNSHSQVNLHTINKSQSHTDADQQISLSNLWSKFDKFDTGSGISTYYMNHTDVFQKTNQTDRNFTLLANRDYKVSENPPWYVNHASNKSKGNTDTAIRRQDNHKDDFHSISTQTYNIESINDKNSPKNIHSTLNSDKPETPKDIGRGDIGPDESIDMHESNNSYNNPVTTMPILPITINNLTEYDNSKSIIKIASTHTEQEVPEDQLTVLGLEQQRDHNKIVVSYNNYANPITLQKDKIEIKQLQNRNENQIQNESNRNHQLKYFGIQTDNSTQKYTNTQNYSNQNIDVEIQNTANFDQDSINMEQENMYKVGQDLQQNENLEQHDLHNYHEILHNNNLEQQNLHNFGEEQVPDVGQENKNIEQHNNGYEHRLNLGRDNKDISHLNGPPFRQESVQKIEKENQHPIQQYSTPKHNDNNKIFIETVNVPNDNVNTNLARVQKSVRVSNLEKNEDHLLQNFGQEQSEKNYGGDYQSGINSYEQEFDQDFNMQYQSRNLHNEQGSEKQKLNKHDIMQVANTSENDLENNLVSSTPMPTPLKGHSLYAQILRPVTPKPSFWKSVGNKFASAKNTIASWFKA